jgi:hypothetical protein
MNKLARGVFLIAVLLIVSLGVSYAGVIITPTGIPYQGRLTDAGGAPVNGARDLTLTLYNSANTALYQETFTGVTVTNGLFSVEIGTGTPVSGTFSAVNFSTHDIFLGVTVGTDPEMAPKIHLGYAPFSLDAPGIVSFHTSGSTNFNSSGVALVGATINVPSPGYVMVTAGGQIYAPAGFFASLDISETPGAFDSNDYGDVSNPGATGQYFQYERHRVYAKGPGTYSFYLNGNGASGYLWQPTMTAIFIPMALGSVTPAPTAAMAPARQPGEPAR